MSEELAQVGGAIALPNVAALQQAASVTDEDFGGISGSFAGFLPRLQLFTSNSEQVKEGKIAVATYGLIKGKDKELVDLGKSVTAIILAWRAKAMFVKVDPPLAYHNPKSPEFQDIKKKADADSNSGNMYGPEFLLWLGPQHGYATFFMGSKTARNEAPSVRALLPSPTNGQLKVATLTSVFIKTDSYSWHGPKCSASAQSMEYPPVETLETTVSTFLAPKDSEKVEAAPEGAANDTR